MLEQYHPAEFGIMSANENALITKILHISEMDILQLRNLRDFTVMYLDRDANREDWDRMSAITYCIDARIFELGGEV